MEHPPTATNTIYFAPYPPPFPASPRSVDLSPLEFILALIAVIAIPALIYTFFFSLRCPPSFFRSRRSDTSDALSVASINDNNTSVTDKESEVVSKLKYQKETHVKDLGSECPVCLSVYSDGEEVKQLSGCKHSFHASCIDMWLNSHSNCPVCRASVGPPPKRPNNRTNSSSASRSDDLHQGLPDASSLV